MAVYIAALGFDKEYKVGYSDSWRQRLMSLRTANRHIKPILVIEGSGEVEHALHKALKNRHLEREIFMLDQDMLDHIILYLSGYAVLNNLRCLYIDEDALARQIPLVRKCEELYGQKEIS